MFEYSSQMYGTDWESFIGISNLAKVVGSEQLSIESSKFSPFNIVTNPLQTQPQGYCASVATKSLLSFQPQQHDHHQNQNQIEVPAWCFEFPKSTADSSNFTTEQNRPSSQFTSSLCPPVAESFLSSNGADCRSSSEKYCKFPSYSGKYSDIQPDSTMPYSQDDKLLRDDAGTDERPLEISFERNQVLTF